jgi:hypothetical protein
MESAYSAEIMGTSSDTASPNKPVFDLATDVVHTVRKAAIDISGRAEPGSLVALYKNGVFQKTVNADPDLSRNYNLGGVFWTANPLLFSDGETPALLPGGPSYRTCHRTRDIAFTERRLYINGHRT